jgi:hypothetical protein
MLPAIQQKKEKKIHCLSKHAHGYAKNELIKKMEKSKNVLVQYKIQKLKNQKPTFAIEKTKKKLKNTTASIC